MIPVSRLFSDDPFDTDVNLPTNPAASPNGQKRMLVVQRIKKISFPPQPDDHEEKEVKDITPDGAVIKKDAIVRDPDSGKKVAIDEPPIVIRRKK